MIWQGLGSCVPAWRLGITSFGVMLIGAGMLAFGVKGAHVRPGLSRNLIGAALQRPGW